ncbi:MAG: ABC transporter ATP-binding protein [Alphaproteobacteria bacterium]|nr:ABC transporter ATP-binding protein [Alphaproteobacteria bacterium]
MAFLSVQKVSKRFATLAAADAVDLEVPQGAFFALLGPSGCGKTTLLRMIAGFAEPDEGIITIDGAVMNGVPANKRPTNMVFQNYAIFPHLNVFDNVAYGLRKEGLGRQALRARVEAMLGTVRLEGLDGRRSDELSGGQRQRVALARALVRRPKLLLLDEPLGALDKRLREAMQVELRGLQKSLGITFLLVTHDQEEALSMADQVAVMSGGRILQIASPRALYERPNCREVADFIGEINFFHATVKSVEGETVTANAGVLGLLSIPKPNFGFGFALGDHILLALRPERITLEGGTVAGEITAASFLGERSHYQVRIAGRGEPVFVAASGPAPPGAVMLGWNPADMIALPFGA